MLDFIENINTADYIQIFILFALVWYSHETHQLRKWQKKQALLTILGLDMQRVKNKLENNGNTTPYNKDFPIIIREIYELNNFNPKVLYSKAFHQPITFSDIVIDRIKKLFKKNKKT